ncbi:TolC family protein [Chitinispirillales bacterium ANBcel5]|uniref:TolC family protein n=1 Tax=Cellulosispirillum alkaliphilum TaxID=3039283 RepID=UPI002A50C004|nr:TolC family protein [Chitinispirillales bacterium ANBcel5]
MRKAMVIAILSLLCIASVSTSGENRVMTLEKCIEQALQSNFNLKAAREKVTETEAGVREALAGYMPQVSTSASYTRLINEPDVPDLPLPADQQFSLPGFDVERNIYNASVTVNQPLFTGGRTRAGHQMAKEATNAADNERIATEKELIKDVTQAYYTVLSSRRSLEAIDSSITLLEQLVTDLKNGVEVGMRGEHELLQAQVQLSNQQLTRRQAQSGADAATGFLANLMGLPIDKELLLDDDIPSPSGFEMPELEDLKRSVRRDNPGIKALENQLSVIENQKRIIRSQNLPNIFASGSYSGDKGGSSLGDGWDDNWTVSLALQWNIFDGGAVRQQQRQAQSQYTQLCHRLDYLRSMMEYQVRTEYMALQDAYEAIAISQKGLEQSRRSYEVTYDKFHQGVVPNSELLNAQNSRLQSEIAYYTALSDFYSKLADLEYLVTLD